MSDKSDICSGCYNSLCYCKCKEIRLEHELASVRADLTEVVGALEEISTHGDDDHECGHTSHASCLGHIQSEAARIVAKHQGQPVA